MQVIQLVLLAAAAAARALASSPHVDITHEMRGLGDPLVLAARATASAAGVSAAGTNKNLQTFTGALGGIKADAVSLSHLFARGSVWGGGKRVGGGAKLRLGACAYIHVHVTDAL